MKKVLSIFAIAFAIAVIAPSCSSDENFEDISSNIQIDQTAPDSGGSGGGGTEPGGGG
ncbi:hypothetical protein [Marinoscillum sp. MHG1-6]|uniref:hypothetical protein n=1 Tax=Marinoscillum sp. MHG1-6 TaxID=2959627 RepID=UPI0021577CC0|nr:hypothetical protein [Marinoscillum sp. MHG1-6]